MEQGKSPGTTKDLASRIREAREKARGQPAKRDEGDGSTGSGLGFAFRVASELVAGLVFGVAVGLFLDNWLNTRPVFLLLFLVLGMAGGIWNVYRLSNRMGLAVGHQTMTEGQRPPQRHGEVDQTEPPPQEAQQTAEDPSGKPH